MFDGAHNAGNDAVANLKTILCIIVNSLFKTNSYDDDDDPEAYMMDVTTPEINIDTGLHKPLSILNTEMLLVCFDAEGVQGDTSEWGFAWIDVAEVCDIAPGKRCENWWPSIKAKHFLREKYKEHLGSLWTDGIPKGFWKEYGSTITYSRLQGSQSFDKMLQEVASQSRKKVSPHLRKRPTPHISATKVMSSDDAAAAVGSAVSVSRKPESNTTNIRLSHDHFQIISSL